MKTAPRELGPTARPPRLETLALGLILAVTAARVHLAEMPYRQAMVPRILIEAAGSRPPLPGLETGELARALFATLLLAAATMMQLAAARRRRETHLRPVAGAIAFFAVWATVSGLLASDVRSGLLVAAEQTALLATGWSLAGACRRREHLRTVLVVLATLGAALAIRGLYQAATAEEVRALAEGPLASDGLSQRLLAARAGTWRPTGYFALANIYASALLALGGALAGVAAGSLRRVASDAAQPPRESADRKSGEIPAPLLAAGLAALLTVGAAAALVLSGSRAGLAAGAIAATGGFLAARKRLWAARNVRRLQAAALVVVLLSAAAAVAWAGCGGRLPDKSLAVRWLYLRGSGRIVLERPLWGTGGGNFPDAYLAVRDRAAEEAVKTPHNLAAHALTQFGLPGGAAYLLILLLMLAAALRPVAAPPQPGADPPRTRLWPSLLAAAAAVAVGRALFFDWMGVEELLLLEAAIPAAVVGVCGLAIATAAQRDPERVERLGRVGLAAGCTALILHNLMTFSLWCGGAATVLWVGLAAAAGATLGPHVPAGVSDGPPVRVHVAGRGRWLFAAALATVTAGAAIFVLLPTVVRAQACGRAVEHLRAGELAPAAREACRAARLDGLDPLSARTATQLTWRAAPREAMVWARIAIERDPDSATGFLLAAQIARRSGGNPSAAAPAGPHAEELSLRFMASAVRRDPHSARLRLTFAEWLAEAGRCGEALEQLAEIERIDRAIRTFAARYDGRTPYALDAAELQRVRRVRRACRVAQ